MKSGNNLYWERILAEYDFRPSGFRGQEQGYTSLSASMQLDPDWKEFSSSIIGPNPYQCGMSLVN